MFQKITNSAQGSFWKPEQIGDSIEGYLMDVQHNQGVQKKSTVYTLRTATGETNVWGCYIIDNALASVKLGTKIKVVYGGKGKTKKGTPLNIYDVYIDEADTIPLTEMSTGTGEMPPLEELEDDTTQYV
jgi:hypothetical protein